MPIAFPSSTTALFTKGDYTMKKNGFLALFLASAILLCSCGDENQSAEKNDNEKSESISQGVESEVITENSSSESSELPDTSKPTDNESTDNNQSSNSESSESAESSEDESTDNAESSEDYENEELLSSGVDGNISWEVRGKTLVIKGNGAMNDYSLEDETEAPWRSDDFARKVKRIVVEEGITTIGKDAFTSMNFEKISLPKTLTELKSGAFSSCDVLQSIVIPDGVSEIGGGAFMGCLSLANVTFPKSLKTIKSIAFDCCYSLKNVILPEGLETIEEGAFEECTSLTEITIPSTVTKIENNAFWNAYNIKSYKIAVGNKNYILEDGVLFSSDKKTLVAFPPANEKTSYNIPKGVEIIEGGAFASCKNLKEIVIPETVKIIGDYAFSECNFKRITIPQGVEEIGSHTFKRCNNIEYIVLPDSVKFIGDYAFTECDKLKRITLSNELKILPAGFLCYCNALESITIPESIEKIEEFAFVLTKVKTINFKGTEEQWNNIEKEHNWLPGANGNEIVKFLK